MSKIRTIEDLRETIRDLEHQNYVNEQHMRKKVTQIADKLKPVNLLKSVVGQVFGGLETKTTLWRMAAGIVTSFVVKKFFRKGAIAK
jgi:hypothetical protein